MKKFTKITSIITFLLGVCLFLPSFFVYPIVSKISNIIGINISKISILLLILSFIFFIVFLILKRKYKIVIGIIISLVLIYFFVPIIKVNKYCLIPPCEKEWMSIYQAYKYSRDMRGV